MKTTFSFLSKRLATRLLAGVVVLVALLTGISYQCERSPAGGEKCSVGARAARAEEGPQTDTLINEKILDLVGLDQDHTRIIGVRLAGGAQGYFSSLVPEDLIATVQALHHGTWPEVMEKLQGVHVPNSLAIAVTFGDLDGEPWRPLDWLELHEVTVVIGVEQSAAYLSSQPEDPHKEGTKTKWGIEMEAGGIKFAIAATFSVHGRRFSGAFVLDRDVDFKGMVADKVKGLRKGKSAASVQETKPESTTPEPKIKSVNTKKAEEAAAKKAKGEEEAKDITLTLAILADELTLGDARDLVGLFVDGPRVLEGMGDRAIVLKDVTTVIELNVRPSTWKEEGLVKSFSILGSGDLGSSGLDAYVLVSVRKVDDDYKIDKLWKVFAGFRLGEFFFKDVAPDLEGSAVGDIWLPSVALTLNFTDEFTLRASDLNAAESAFYDDVRIPYPSLVQANYKLRIRKGLGLTGPTPLNFLPTAARRVLGIKNRLEAAPESESETGSSTAATADAASVAGDRSATMTKSTAGTAADAADAPPRVIVEGNPGIPFGLDFAGLPRLSDMSLRIELPELEPENAPAWFVSGKLAIEITGRPSIALVGEITADIDGDRLTFSLSGELGRSAAGVEFSLSGGLVAEQPWVSPFGIEWLTLNRLMLTLSVKPAGLGLGFRADVKIGARTVDVAVFVAMSAAGVPTGFAFEGRTNKLSLDDLATLQVKMAKAAGRAGPRFPLGALPNVEVRDLYVKFAPTAVPSLDIDAGFALAGQVWVETDRSGTMTKVAEVDVSVGEGGITVYGSIQSLVLGPIRVVNGVIDLELTLENQSLSLSGKAILFGITRTFSIEVTGSGMVADFIAEHGPAVGAKVAAAKETAKKAAQQLRGRISSLRGRLFRN